MNKTELSIAPHPAPPPPLSFSAASGPTLWVTQLTHPAVIPNFLRLPGFLPHPTLTVLQGLPVFKSYYLIQEGSPTCHRGMSGVLTRVALTREELSP